WHRSWKSRIEKGIPSLEIPADYRTHRDDSSGAVWRFMIDNQLTEKLKKLAGTYNTTLFTIMFAGYILLLSRFANQKDVACSIIHSGREHVGLYKIIGFFVNSLIFTTHVDDEESFSDFLRRTANDILELFQHQDYPAELVFEELKTQYPTVPVSFNLLNMQDETAFIEAEVFEMFHSE
ncbi:MAG: hypothetical protein GY940_43285, partial [bacterium]|nr:hypothetical protein [bacterium]